LYGVNWSAKEGEMNGREGSREEVAGVAGEVPFVARPPEGGRKDTARVVVGWHLLDPPRTESAFAAAMPLAGLDAWRVYLGLPMTGSRMPAGGADEVLRLGYEDAVLNVYGPISDQAVREFEPAFEDIRDRLGIADGPIGVMGGSLGAAIALRVIAESDVEVRAGVLVSPMIRLRSVVQTMERQFGITYRWSAASESVADRLDFVARANEISGPDRGPAILLAVGEADDVPGFRQPALELREALARRDAETARAEFVLVRGMGHAFAEEPGIAPAPQTPPAAELDRRAVDWFRRYLTS
jgi:dienelactone hydrolase